MKARRSSPCRTGQCNFSAGLFNQRPDFLETGSAQFTQCLATRPQPIRDDRIRSGVALHQFPEEFQGGLAISLIRDKGLQHLAFPVHSVVAWIGAEMEFPLSQAVASGDAFEHRPSECGHCVQNFLAELDLRDLPGEAAGFELGADDALPTADLRFYPAALVVPCGRLPGHAAIAADLGNMAIPNGRIPRRLRADHCVLRRRYNHIQDLPIPFPQQISCKRSIIGAVRQKTRDRGIELIQEPG